MLKAHPAPNPTISFYILYHSLISPVHPSSLDTPPVWARALLSTFSGVRVSAAILLTMPTSSSPSFSFGGRGISRDPTHCARTLFVPGPGSYTAQGSTGRQLDSRHKSAAMSRFPVTDRAQASKVFAGTATLDFVCSQHIPRMLLVLREIWKENALIFQAGTWLL